MADGRAVTGRDMRPPDHMLDLAGVPRGVHGPYKLSGSGGVLWTNSIIPLFAQKRPLDKVLAPTRCGNGHELTPDNLIPAECGTRWRCRQCGAERAAAWRRRHSTAA